MKFGWCMKLFMYSPSSADFTKCRLCDFSWARTATICHITDL